MTCVTHAGSSTELWRFDTRTRGWKQVETVAGPGTRKNHVITSVGPDLWMHGGAGAGESQDELFLLVHCAGRTWNWSDIEDVGVTVFTRIYDDDVIQVLNLFK